MGFSGCVVGIISSFMEGNLMCPHIINIQLSDGSNILKMRKVDKQNIFPYYGIDLVDPKDLKEIISILESKGVTVVTKDLRV